MLGSGKKRTTKHVGTLKPRIVARSLANGWLFHFRLRFKHPFPEDWMRVPTNEFNHFLLLRSLERSLLLSLSCCRKTWRHFKSFRSFIVTYFDMKIEIVLFLTCCNYRIEQTQSIRLRMVLSRLEKNTSVLIERTINLSQRHNTIICYIQFAKPWAHSVHSIQQITWKENENENNRTTSSLATTTTTKNEYKLVNLW